MTTDTFLLTGGRILSMDPAIGELDGDVLVENGTITAVGPKLRAPGVRIVDAASSWVLPGFIDTHRHCWQGVVRFAGVGWDVATYMERAHGKVAPAISPEDAYLGNKLSAFACLDAGITTVCDESHVQHSTDHTEALIRALSESGIRARFGFGWSAGPKNLLGSTDPHPAHVDDVRTRILHDDSRLVTMYAMLRGPVLSSLETCIADIARARALGLRMSFHVGHPNSQGMSEISLLHDAGVMGPDMHFIHGGECSDDELRMMAQAGVGLSVSPTVESWMAGLGAPATTRALNAGVQVSFSADTELAASGDMFSIMRAAFTADQLRRTSDPSYRDNHRQLTPAQLLEFATIGGARVCGIADRVGSLTPGKQADVILIDREAPNIVSSADSATAIVTAAHAGNVKAVFVDGRERKAAGALTEFREYARLRPALRAAADRLRDLHNR
ncbi:amidohydrolase family protein [Herbiconiux sp. UC225_62]|uniref:amidohydrolase family protein n=1 Tax=Herbiconiux sp. UC225_62 TaxID=3350168 RepID=UPI0036D254ED